MTKTFTLSPIARLMTALGISLLLTAAVSARPAATVDHGRERAQHDNPIAGDHMGTCYAFYQLGEQDLPPIAGAAGSRWDRFDFRWNVIEGEGTRRSPFNFGPHDEIVNRDVDHGLNIIGILGSTPKWAAPDCPILMNRQSQQPATDGAPIFPFTKLDDDEPYWWRPCPPQGLNLAWDHPDNLWGHYVYETVSHFKDRVTVWEIWNEPDLGQVFWSGSPAQYAQLLKVGYQAVKAADPDATVLFAGLAYWSSPSYYVTVLDTLHQMPGAAEDNYYFDAMSLHLYSNVYQIRPIAAEIQANMATRVGPHPIWLTETGVPLWDEWPDDFPIEQLRTNRATAEEAAAYVIQAFAESRAIGIEKFLFFRTHDEAMLAGTLPPPDEREVPEYFGLIRNDLSLRPAYHAFSVTAHYLHGENQVTGPFTNSGVRRITFWGTPQGRIDLLWNETGAPITYTHPAHLPTATLVDMAGRIATASASDGALTLTLPPATADTAEDGSFLIGGPPLLVIHADTTPPSSTLHALPDALYTHTLPLTWDVQDAGTGYWYGQIQQRTVPDGVWKTVLDWSQTQGLTQTMLTMDRGGHYSFRLRARDHAGNWEAWQADAQITTTLILTRTVTLSATTYIDANSNNAWDTDEILAPDDTTIIWRTVAGTPITTSVGANMWITETVDAGDYLLTARSPGYLMAQTPLAIPPGREHLAIERRLGLKIIRAHAYLPLIARQP